MINSESSSLNIDGNEDSGTELRVNDRVDILKADYIPSYVGLSCAVSGYRPINRYDGASHEHCSANLTSQLAFLCGNCKAASSHLYNESITGEQSNNDLDNLASSKAGLCTGLCSKPKMNLNSGNLSCSQFVRLMHNSDVGNSDSIEITSSVSCFTKEIKDDETNGKSFVQQRIERLYGPTALGAAFQTKKSFLQKLKDEERKEGSDNRSKIEEESPPSEQFPSVFRHLRPEFRHQLPVKSRTTVSQTPLTSDISNGYSFKRNLVPNNTTTSQEPNKTWKSLSKELENVGQSVANEHIAADHKPESRIASSPLRELTNGEAPQLNHRNNVSQTKIEDGNYFLEIVAKEVTFFESQIKKIESDLSLCEEAMSEEVRGKLLSTSGKAKLFINKKLKQFQGLCYKNLSKFSEEEFPTTNEDLAGFWDMVRLQVDHIKILFKEVDALRLNSWQESDNSPSPAYRAAPKRTGAAKKPQSIASDVRKNVKGGKQESESDERRRNMRQMLSAKRKEINKAKDPNGTSADVEIFVHAK